MKFFLRVAVSAFLFGTPALANEVSGVEVTGVIQETTADVFPLSPGVARIEMGPLYGVFLNEVPPEVTTYSSDSDQSGKGTVYMTRWQNMPYTKERVCFKEPGARWNSAPMCGVMLGTMASITIDVGARRNQSFALVPVVIDRDTNEILSWIAHPKNTQTQLRCGSQEDTASVFYVDEAGTIGIATPEQVRAYASTYCKGG